MVNNDYTRFRGVTSMGDTMLLNELENNLQGFLSWGLLGIGAFVNVYRPTTSTIDSGRFDVLRVSSDPSYPAGTVYESIRKDWVWETGVNFNGHIPISISGVYVNNQFFAPSHVTYGHRYDYPNGRVIFNSSVPTSSGVSLEYSYRTVQVYTSDEADWFFEGQYESYRPGGAQWVTHAPDSGNFAIPPHKRVQFPAIIIEPVPRGVGSPWELGNLAMLSSQDVLFNIVAETRNERNKLVDILRMENDHIIWLYDSDEVVASGAYPLDYRGMLVNSTGTYPYLVDNYRFTTCRFKNVTVSSVEGLSPFLHEGKVRATMELILNNL